MVLRVPDYFLDFHCVAAACPRNCCIGWEIVIDDKTAAHFKNVPSPLGDRLRAALTYDGEGERCMLQTPSYRCPFLNSRNLCEIYLTLGEESTGAVCRTHPRFTEEFGCLRETSLSASCPETARLLLASEKPLTFPSRKTEEPAENCDDWLLPLLTCRKRGFAILQDRRLPWRIRALWFLLFSNNVQALLDDDRVEDLPELCKAFCDLPAELPKELTAAGEGLFPEAVRVLKNMEILEDDWLPLLHKAETATAWTLPDWAMERISCYFVFRYFLRAINDGDLLSRAELTVFGALCVEHLAGYTMTAEAALYRFCRELEHDRDNLKTLREKFYLDPALSLKHFFEELCKKL